jgi:uncharacterized protein
MKINVAQLLKEAVGSERIYKFEELMDENDNVPITGTLTLIRTSRGLLGKGTVFEHVPGICCRCLTAIDIPLNFEFTDEFFPSTDIITGQPIEKGSNGSFIDHNHILDLTEVVRQYTVVNIPMKQLCHPSCSGICPSCGKNLNTGSCACTQQRRDKRWEKLVNLGKE